MGKRVFLFILAMTALLLAGCEGEVVSNRELARIDSLLEAHATDSAWAALSDINTKQLANEGEEAYYGLLRTQAMYLQGKADASDTLIRQSVNYYENSGSDKDKLARACLYEGATLKSLDRKEEAVLFLKESEELCLELRDYKNCYRVYNILSSINANANEYILALDYARKNLDIAKRLNNTEWKVNAYNQMAVAFDGLKEKDSAKHYINLCIPIIEKCPRESFKAQTYNNISYFNVEVSPDLALNYAQKAMALKPSAVTLGNIAHAIAHKGDEAKADSLWKEALAMASIRNKVRIATSLLEHKHQMGDTRAAEAVALKLMVWKDSLGIEERKNKVEQAQAEYEFNKKLQQKDIFTEMLAACTGALILALIAFALYSRYRKRRDVKKYATEIKKLKQENEVKSHKAEEQTKYIRRLSEDRHESIDQGLRLFEALKGGETIVRWKDEDFENFFTYYFTKDSAFMTSINADYVKLSNLMKLYLILVNEAWENKDIANTLGVKVASLRVIKKRVRDKMKPADGG